MRCLTSSAAGAVILLVAAVFPGEPWFAADAGAPPAPSVVVVFPTDERGWSDYGLRPARIRTVQSDAQGAFAFDDLPAGDYFVAAVRGTDPTIWQDAGFFARVRPSAARVTVDWGGRATANPRLVDIR